jgi:predicted double-glycine peptidase
MADLRNHTAKGRPVIVCLGPASHAEPHFVVVAGIDENEAIFNDPARGKFVREPLRKFAREWRASRNWALLALPR